MRTVLAIIGGWLFWSLSHHLGHRTWHRAIRMGSTAFYAEGEKAHHIHYDTDIWKETDPNGAHRNFPYGIIIPALLLPVVMVISVWNLEIGITFAVSMYFCMFFDGWLHYKIHTHPDMVGIMGWFQKRHLMHHANHDSHFSFGTGCLWDWLLRKQ